MAPPIHYPKLHYVRKKTVNQLKILIKERLTFNQFYHYSVIRSFEEHMDL